MSTWKRVLTTDDVDNITDTNLASSDLDQSDNFRTYTLPTYASGSSLTFSGNVSGNTENLLKIVADSNSANRLYSYVYTPRLTIGNYSLSGNQGANGYSLPQFSSSLSQGKIMVTNAFSTDDGEVLFKSVEEWLGPSGSAYSYQGNPELSTLSDSDKVPVYDQSAEKFGYTRIDTLTSALSIRSYLAMGLNASIQANPTSTPNINGEDWLTTVNGVKIGGEGKLPIFRDCTITGAAFHFGLYTATNGSQTNCIVTFYIYKNGLLQDEFETGPHTAYGTESYPEEYTDSSSFNISCSAEDVISIKARLVNYSSGGTATAYLNDISATIEVTI